jgi:hypothetical protein
LDSDALVAYSVAYEFEDIFAAVTSAQRIDVTDLPALEFSRRAYKLAWHRGRPGLTMLLRLEQACKYALERHLHWIKRMAQSMTQRDLV